MGVELGGWSFGAQFGDLNNDGYLDLYLTNGYISADRNRSYWYDFSKVAGGNTAIIPMRRTGHRWKAAVSRGISRNTCGSTMAPGNSLMWRRSVGVTDTYDGRAVALADLWNRGVLDVVVVNQKGPLLLYKNTVTPDHTVDRVCPGRQRQQPQCHWRAGAAVLEWAGASARGLGWQRIWGAESAPLAFRLGKQPHVEKVVIRWPSGKVQTLTAPQIGQVHQVKEPG